MLIPVYLKLVTLTHSNTYFSQIVTNRHTFSVYNRIDYSFYNVNQTNEIN